MRKLEILISLLHLHNMDLGEFDMDELKIWLRSLRAISREIEREIISRERSLEESGALPVLFGNVN